MLIIQFLYGTESKALHIDEEIVQILKADPGENPTVSAKNVIMDKLTEVVARKAEIAADIQAYIAQHITEAE